MIAMGIMGIGWATTLSVPFALLAAQVPPGKEGVLMGTFNIFIAAPMFLASALAGVLVMQTHNDASALVLGGVSILLSAFLLQLVKE
jgi:maltose/moltooligosaccharide transporter